MLTLVIFVTINGHHAMLRGVRASFDTLAAPVGRHERFNPRPVHRSF
jgi:flagellar biosynthesis protein FliR